MVLADKTVLILSPEPWGKSKISKHHYALAFAQKGYKVYFLNLTLQRSKSDEICEDNSQIILSYIYVPPYLNRMRFHFRPLYNFLLPFKIAQWKKEHSTLSYLVSFDCNGVFTDLSAFGAAITIFFPVDQVPKRFREEYKGFDKLLSISPVILRSFPKVVDKMLLNHGLSPYFESKKYAFIKKAQPKKIAYVGNLLIGPILDKTSMKAIIANHPELEFHFFGAYTEANSNLGSELSKDTLYFLDFLKSSMNCELHGPVSPEELADAYESMDAFLLCYDYRYDKNECSNSHKIVEYLSTGKPIISTRISMYDNKDLFPMLKTFDNSPFSDFFETQIENWPSIFNLTYHKKRLAFANSNTYNQLLEKILNH